MVDRDGEVTQRIEALMADVELFPEPRRGLVKQMLDGPVGSEYFTAPASGREEYHSAFPGGLAYHSFNVAKTLGKLASTLCPGRWSDHTLNFVAMFHDLGKAGDGVEPYYVVQNDQWRRKNYGEMYTINPDCMPMPTSERGLFLLQQHGITLSAEETLAIRLNDGQYVDENRYWRNGSREPDLALLVHWADNWSTRQEKREVKVTRT